VSAEIAARWAEPLSVYHVPRNNIPVALEFVKAKWGQLRPEDFSILYKLQDDPSALRRELDQLFDALRPTHGAPLRRRR
jgi:hypothetical protein